MSTLSYYVKCPACGATGPTFSVGRMPWDPDEIRLPAANLVTRELDAEVIRATEETIRVPLVELARRHTTATRIVSAPDLSAEPLRLVPPLRCPRCGALIDHAEWGVAPVVTETGSLDEIVARSRETHDSLDFTISDGRFDIFTDAEIDGDRHEIGWQISRRDDSADLRTVVDDLVTRLKAAGSDISDPDIRDNDAYFTETLRDRRR